MVCGMQELHLMSDIYNSLQCQKTHDTLLFEQSRYQIIRAMKTRNTMKGIAFQLAIFSYNCKVLDS